MPRKEEFNPLPYVGGYSRMLERMLDDLRWEEATEEAMKKRQQSTYARPEEPRKYEKKYKTG